MHPFPTRTVQWDVTDAVNIWAQAPLSNNGVLLLPTSGGQQFFARSSNHSDAANRPKLTVRFELQPRPQTPTPTPTATPTATLTPTLTPTPSPTSVPASVQGVVYEDANANGMYDPGEPLLAGAQLHLTGNATDLTQTTAADGAYAFTDLAAGSYNLTETQPSGYGPGIPASPLVITLNAGNAVTMNFGHQPLPTATPTWCRRDCICRWC